MNCKVKWKQQGCADGEYTIRAKGFLVAVLSWANQKGVLPEWSPFAYIPLDSSGNGLFHFGGHRAIPRNATHIHLRCIASDFVRMEEMLTEIPEMYRMAEDSEEQLDGDLVGYSASEKSLSEETNRKSLSVSVMSDLHLTSKSGRIRQALLAAEGEILLLPGDLTNDAAPEQFQEFRNCIEEIIPNKLLLAVTGNHDMPYFPQPLITEPCSSYYGFQDWLAMRSENLGYTVKQESHGAYSVRIGRVEIIGLQCVSHWRKFVFLQGEQIEWLERHLEQEEIKELDWHIILCHAPLLRHNPHRNEGQPYLSRDTEIQRIVDSHSNIIFLSGHTHVSPNVKQGCAEFDAERNILYLNDGSIVPTDLKENTNENMKENTKENVNENRNENFRGKEENQKENESRGNSEHTKDNRKNRRNGSNGSELLPFEWRDGVVTELRIWKDEIEIKTKSALSGLYYPRGYYHFWTKQ